MKHWIQAARLRTLPLSISGIIAGSAVAAYHNEFNNWVFIIAILTTIGLQVISNFANDYGDGVKGTDNEDRVGPKRALQAGVITPAAMKNAIIITSLITFILALVLIFLAFKDSNLGYSIFFILLGIAAIGAAIKYTVGKSAYGYNGLGDIFVFVFFGLVSVIGSYFLYTKVFYIPIVFLGISIGLLCVAVLNLNNMRDRESDKKANKNTLVVKLGTSKAKKYHNSILVGAMISIVVFTILNKYEISHWIYIVTFAPLIKHLGFVNQNEKAKDLDPELKKVALTTFFMTVLFSIGLLIW